MNVISWAAGLRNEAKIDKKLPDDQRVERSRYKERSCDEYLVSCLRVTCSRVVHPFFRSFVPSIPSAQHLDIDALIVRCKQRLRERFRSRSLSLFLSMIMVQFADTLPRSSINNVSPTLSPDKSPYSWSYVCCTIAFLSLFFLVIHNASSHD